MHKMKETYLAVLRGVALGAHQVIVDIIFYFRSFCAV